MNQEMRKIIQVFGGTALVATSINLKAETMTPAPIATVKVQNAFTLDHPTALDFGTIRAKAVVTSTGADNVVGGDFSTITLASIDGVSTVSAVGATAIMQTLIPGTAGIFTIAGVAPFSFLTITLPTATPAAPLVMTAGSAPPGTAYFLLHSFEATVTSGTKNGSAYTSPGDLTADTNGDASFTLGAQLSTSDPATGTTLTQGNYLDLDYTATYTMEVNY
ncbi:hypothetical protein [Psychromonas sp. Urea-02u-13]|uniref:hypothetical protein n=1 Tax=Psychromonas sp. Urea-02u-13 TaxID=2058326 RepID=UPI000C33E33E|nr:hypothetical protein [Psychromonas sp. Urea-02u-13]PKG37796.1 hypothetical protein CXF74_16960 [Psychromonas sp. Urea-02u-13]